MSDIMFIQRGVLLKFSCLLFLSSTNKNYISALEPRSTVGKGISAAVRSSCLSSNNKNPASGGHYHRNSQQNNNIYECIRGGGAKNDDEEQENRELDAYIEELIASVDDDDDSDGEEEEDDTSDDESISESSEDKEDADDEEKEEEEEEEEEDDEEEDSGRENEEGKDDPSIDSEKSADHENDDPADGDVEFQTEEINEEKSHDVDVDEEISLTKTKPESSNGSTDVPGKTQKSRKKKTPEHHESAKKENRSNHVRRKRKKDESSSSSSGNKIPKSDKKISSVTVDSKSKGDVTPQSTPTAAAVYRRPNTVYRFLLGQGRIGHFVVMLCIAVVEFIQRYIPELMKLVSYVMVKLFGTSYELESQGRERGGYPTGEETAGVSGKVNAKYAAFVSTDGSTVRGSSGKRKKAMTKKADQAAAEQLRQVGSIREAKYRHLSVAFMKRHKIGPFRTSEAATAMGESLSDVDIVETTEESALDVDVDGSTSGAIAEDESDVDWVVEAFAENNEDAKDSTTGEDSTKGSESYVEPTMSVGLGSTGATLSVGLDIGFGKKKKKRSKSRRPRSVLEAVTETKVTKRTQKKPRASDSEGGGGVLGRIRAASANSLIARNLSGAYPGDAVPPNEAGDANGVIDLARKYGYGDWSDDDDEEEEYDDYAPKRHKKKVRKTASGGSTTKRRKKKRVSSKGPTLSVGFDLHSGSAGRSRRESAGFSHTRKSRRSPSTLSHTKKKRTSRTAVERSDILKPSKADVRKRLQSEKMVRLPTQRLKEKELQDRLQKDKE